MLKDEIQQMHVMQRHKIILKQLAVFGESCVNHVDTPLVAFSVFARFHVIGFRPFSL